MSVYVYKETRQPFADGSHPCLQLAELAFTSSVSGPPNAPGVQGSQLEGDFWKVCPLQQHDAPECCDKSYLTGLKITPIHVYY